MNSSLHSSPFQARGFLPGGAATLGCRDDERQVETLSLRHQQFLAIERGFRPHGGLASGEDIARDLRGQCDQPLSVVAHWIVSRAILSITWREQILIPMFQFDQGDVSLRTSVMQIVGDLLGIFDDWELALWLAQPNTRLNGASPVALIHGDGLDIRQAARADRRGAGAQAAR